MVKIFQLLTLFQWTVIGDKNGFGFCLKTGCSHVIQLLVNSHENLCNNRDISLALILFEFRIKYSKF